MAHSTALNLTRGVNPTVINMAYQNILAAVDLTEDSQPVIEKALEIARNQSAILRLLTVIKPLAHAYGGLDLGTISEVSANLEKEAFTSSERQLKQLAKDKGIDDDKVDVVFGSPAATIKAQAEAMDIDLIVIGSHGRHGLGLLLGSTATGVLHGVEQDVLTVRLQDNE